VSVYRLQMADDQVEQLFVINAKRLLLLVGGGHVSASARAIAATCQIGLSDRGEKLFGASAQHLFDASEHKQYTYVVVRRVCMRGNDEFVGVGHQVALNVLTVDVDQQVGIVRIDRVHRVYHEIGLMHHSFVCLILVFDFRKKIFSF
jgi:hypothetical protein